MPGATRKCPQYQAPQNQANAPAEPGQPPRARPSPPQNQATPQNQAKPRQNQATPAEPGHPPEPGQPPGRTRPTPRQSQANEQNPQGQGATRGVPGGRPPGQALRAKPKPPRGGEHRATPGGYGGKPPGVAIIGVPTGARNAGSGAPTGDQSTDMNVTRKRPRLCQDPITTGSRDGAEQANHERDKLSLERGRVGRWPFPPVASGGTVGSRVAGTFGLYSMKPRVLSGSRPPLANTTAK